ncbi:hypothetical protein AcV5_009193 [Taiwanofungus camphoratus]|nr:hypothetical protein AcV5_009193 [Antrodia cinnamomea]
MLEPCTGVPRRCGCAQRPRRTLNARPGSSCAHTGAHRGLAILRLCNLDQIFSFPIPLDSILSACVSPGPATLFILYISHMLSSYRRTARALLSSCSGLSAYVTYSASYYVPAPPLARAHTLLVLTAFDSGSDSASVLLRGTARRARLSAVRGFGYCMVYSPDVRVYVNAPR